MTYTLHCGDRVDYMATMADATYSAVFCDPPYGLGETPDMAEVLTHWLAGDDYKANGGALTTGRRPKRAPYNRHCWRWHSCAS